jgi:hypothetical protein
VTTLTGFTCPKCGAQKDDPETTIEADVVYERPLVRLWEGGPLVEDLAEEPRPRVVDRVLGTDACGCSFPLSEWDVAVYGYASGNAGLEVTPKVPSS